MFTCYVCNTSFKKKHHYENHIKSCKKIILKNLNELTNYQSPYKKIRIGNKNKDGGYVVVEVPNIKYNLILSCGIDKDISFEEEFIEKHKNIECFSFDGTIEKLPKENNKINFIKKNIGEINNENITNLHEFLNNYTNIFLKMDIEGWEVPWIKTLNFEQLNQINQIVIECHDIDSDDKMEIFTKLNQCFYMVHFHPNNGCGIRNINNILVPKVFECTFLNKRFFNKTPELNKDNIPSILDQKNDIRRNEMIINYKPFVFSDTD